MIKTSTFIQQLVSIKWFWLILFIMLFIVNEHLINWILSSILGPNSMIEGYRKIFKNYTLDNYLFSLILRSIPYLLLTMVVLILSYKRKEATAGIAWGGLFGIAALWITGAVFTYLPLYTKERMGSTDVLIFLVLPVFAIFSGLIGGLIGWGISVAARE